MTRRIVVLVVATTFCAPAYGQGVALFQNGVTMLPGGSLYQGTVDTEFRADAPTTSHEFGEEISIDQFDGGFQTQAAIRFDDLLASQGGLVPDELPREGIVFAEFRLWKSSGTDVGANIDFNRVVGPDTTSGAFWQGDDTWASMGGDLIPDEFGLLDGDPIKRDGVEAAVNPDFQDKPERFGTENVVINPDDGPVLASLVYTEGVASDDVFGDAWDGTPEDLNRAINVSFWRFNVTEVMRDWLADTNPGLPGTQPLQGNHGWSISNDTGNGWDFITSDLMESLESEFDELDPALFRPSLTILFDDGSAGILDLDKDGDVDLDDYDDFLPLLASELDAPLSLGAPGDFDFDRDVDLNDFKYFKLNFPGGPEGLAAALAGVPEPSAGLLLAMALAGSAAIGRRRQLRRA